MRKLLVPVAALAVSSPVLEAQTPSTLVVPAAAAGSDLGEFTLSPLVRNPAERALYVYDASHFAGITTPIDITRIRLRADGRSNTWTGASQVGNISLDLSTAAVDYLDADPVFDTNHGGDRTQVYVGPQAIAAGTATVGSPGPFVVDIAFTVPFTYYPASGKDLVLDFVSAGLFSVVNVPELDASKDGAVAMARSVSLPVPGSATGGVADAALAVEFSYLPGTALTAAFAPSVTEGPSPLTVNFTDLSYSSAPGGIVSWAWDFDNDGTPDSTVQNPSFTYTTCGTSTVSLTVMDAVGSATSTEVDLITTDEVAADFGSDVAVGPAPLAVQFTDMSAGTPSSWAWDLDGDGVVDSTLQNPSFTYGATGVYDVTLTVTRNCNTSTVTKPAFIKVANALTTTFGNSNGIDPPGGVFFDVQVFGNGIEVTGLEQNINETLGTPFALDLYLTGGGWAGKDDDITQWRKVASGTGVSAGVANPSFVGINSFYLPPGNYGIAIYCDVRQRYVNGNGANQSVSNADLALALGRARSSLFGDPPPGTLLPFYEPRVWNGSILYTATPGDVYNVIGEGCPHSAGVTTLTRAPGSSLRLGMSFGVDVGPLPASSQLVFFIIGYTNVSYQGTPLPLELTPFGLTGCTLWAEPFAIDPLFAPGGTATWSPIVPTDPIFAGQQVYNQALVLDPTANSLGAVLSDGAAGVIGF